MPPSKKPTYDYPVPKEEPERWTDDVDYRTRGGPRLSYLWCQENDNDTTLSGQSLYLGGEVGCDGRVYCIPGHAPRVLVIDQDRVSLLGPELLPGMKFKWLRGVVCGDIIYGLPCHADVVLRIHVPSGQVTTLAIPYEAFYGDSPLAKQQRQQEWKYHGGTISPTDGCIYTIPQSALHVLRIDPRTESCQLVGPALPGRYKWYGGVVGQADGAIYGIPHNSPHVLRIEAHDKVTLHGDLGDGGHKWHGASAAPNGVIVAVPANADTVLCITPVASGKPVLTQLAGCTESTIQTGRHRTDRRYKYLGAMTGTDGKVYCFPSGSEHVLQIDATANTVRSVGPNIYDAQMERLCQNKWQNGLVLNDYVFAVPLSAESVLQIDCSIDPPAVTTWPLPSPHKGLAKWEGGLSHQTASSIVSPTTTRLFSESKLRNAL